MRLPMVLRTCRARLLGSAYGTYPPKDGTLLLRVVECSSSKHLEASAPVKRAYAEPMLVSAAPCTSVTLLVTPVLL